MTSQVMSLVFCDGAPAGSEEKLHILGKALEHSFGSGPKPACTLIPVPRLALDGMLFEVDAVAAMSQ